MVLITERKCIYCAVRPKYLVTLQFKFLKELARDLLTLSSKAVLHKLIGPNLFDKFAAFDVTFNFVHESPPLAPYP